MDKNEKQKLENKGTALDTVNDAFIKSTDKDDVLNPPIEHKPGYNLTGEGGEYNGTGKEFPSTDIDNVPKKEEPRIPLMNLDMGHHDSGNGELKSDQQILREHESNFKIVDVKIAVYNPLEELDKLIDYYKKANPLYVDALAHLETAKFKINNIR